MRRDPSLPTFASSPYKTPLEPAALQRCAHCGHSPDLALPDPHGDAPITRDVARDEAALAAARRGVQLILEVAAGRRPASALARHATRQVIACVRALEPVLGRPRTRIRRFHTSQPHEGAVEVNTLVHIDRPRALTARFELVELDRWACVSLRIL
ncbi:Rv3235 family protein [Pseudonocardia kujensis]|uniref:Rv3235 family protein n=1 Tax=Pseudonocardia kujensis TaxID=1128675 RepID=UPI001E3E22B4|nr:Rv3235 family protein [Pseudonocardia kujensis]MCE0765960.1 Rv3235 family protein [Pseudonocardia kujensis]